MWSAKCGAPWANAPRECRSGCVSEVGIGCFRDEGQEGQEGEGGEEPEACRPEDPKTRRPEDRFRRVPTSSGAGTPRAAISHGKRHRVAPGHPSAADRQAAPKFVQAPEFAGLGPHASRRCARATTSDTIADCRAVCRGSCRARPGAPSIGAAARREFVRPGAQARPRSGSSVG